MQDWVFRLGFTSNNFATHHQGCFRFAPIGGSLQTANIHCQNTMKVQLTIVSQIDYSRLNVLSSNVKKSTGQLTFFLFTPKTFTQTQEQTQQALCLSILNFFRSYSIIKGPSFIIFWDIFQALQIFPSLIFCFCLCSQILFIWIFFSTW